MACIPYVVLIFRYSYFSSLASLVTRLGGKEGEQASTEILNGAMLVGYLSVQTGAERQGLVEKGQSKIEEILDVF